MSSNRDMSDTYYASALERARALPDSELERHARVARLEGGSRCRQCFCCACEQEQIRRAHEKQQAERAERLRRFL